MPDEPHAPAKIVIVDPRRTVSVNACEVEAGKDNVLHLAINSGTDLALFNAIFTHIAEQGWVDRDFIDASTLREGASRPPLYPARGEDPANPGHLTSFEDALEGCRTSLEEAAEICGVAADDIAKAAEWIAMPKEGGKRRRTMIGYEKGLIWGNDNYRTNGAIVNIALATGNVGRMGGGVVRLGGHQEGYVRPSAAHVGRPAPYVDQLLISGEGGVHHIWGCDHYKTTVNALQFKSAYKKRTDMVKDAINAAPAGDRQAVVDAIVEAIRQGGLFAVDVDIVPTRIGEACHVVLPAATSGEMNLTSMNGERRMRLTEKYMDAPGQAMPDCLIAARLANHMERVLREAGDDAYADQFQGFDWQTEEDAFMDGYHQNASGGEHVTYERLRAMGTNGFQEPATGVDDDGKIIGTTRLYTNGTFSTDDGKARFMDAPWRGLQTPGKQEEKETFPFLINNGRANQVWQSAYLDVDNDLVMDRWPYPFIEMHPDDMGGLGVSEGDLVEVWNDNGSTQAMAYPTPTAKRGETFMLFGFPTGVQGNVTDGTNELVVPELQANLGQHPQDFGRAARREAHQLQVEGIHGLNRNPPGGHGLCPPGARSQAALVDAGRDLFRAFLALAVAVGEIIRAVAQKQRELHQLFHHVHDPVIQRRGLHPPVLVELQKRLGHRGLVRDRDHAHPAPEHAKLVDRVEALRPAGDLHHRQRLALGGAHAAERQRNPVDLRLHDTGHRAVALRRAPHHAFGPHRQLAQLLHLGMARLGVVGQRQAGRVEGPRLGPEAAQDARGFLARQPAVGARA